MDEVIKSVTQAELQAQEIKQRALEKAAEISAQAEIKAAELEKKCEEDCKETKAAKIKQAEVDAQALYNKTVGEKTAQAEDYAKKHAALTDSVIEDIVRRVTGGSR